MDKSLLINEADNVAVALVDLEKGDIVLVGDKQVTLQDNIPRGHKFSLEDITLDQNIIKYGVPIGHAISDIGVGQWVHTHNLKTNLNSTFEYTYEPELKEISIKAGQTFMGYPRAIGNAGIRNEVWVIPTVGCVNAISERIARTANAKKHENIDGVYSFGHSYGCSQLGDDHENTIKALAGLVNHPNAGGVLVVGLGCENNTIDVFKEKIGNYDPQRVKFMITQKVDDEFATGMELIAEIIEYTSKMERQPCDISELVVGLKCGGSDGLSGITANPIVGMASDKLISAGGSTILTEVPEMFGAEMFLMKRAINIEVFDDIVNLINSFKEYFQQNNQPIYENPSPGNKEGGITTLEDKSLGCTQKGGTAPVVAVLDYGEKATEKGLNLLYSPGNDLVAASALAISGAQIVVFTTGRGTPFGSPVPTLKVSSNSQLAQKKPHWIDFNAGKVIDGISFAQVAEELYQLILETANGEQTRTEEQEIRELAIFKTGVTL